jgi:hypothetical protein
MILIRVVAETLLQSWCEMCQTDERFGRMVLLVGFLLVGGLQSIQLLTAFY